MNFERTKWHQIITISALILAVVALPFSIAICHSALILLAINWIAEGRWKTKWERVQKNTLLWPFIALFFMHVIGLMYSEDKTNGIFNLEKKISFLVLPVIVATSHIESRHLTFLLKSWVGACLAAVFICIGAAFYRIMSGPDHILANFDLLTSEKFKSINPTISLWSYFSYQELSSGIRIHPTYLGLYIVFSIAILIYFFEQNEDNYTPLKKVGFFLILLLFSIFIISLSSKIIIVSLVLLYILSAWMIFLKKKKKHTLIYLFALIMISLSFLFINPVAKYRSVYELNNTGLKVESNTQYAQSTDIRFSLWWLGMKSLEDNWIMGAGTGDVTATMEHTGKKFNITNILGTYDPHNQFIYTALSLGIIGFSLLLGCFLLPFILQNAFHDFLYLVFISIIFLTCLSESLFELQKGIVFFSIFNSLLVFQVQKVALPSLKPSHA